MTVRSRSVVLGRCLSAAHHRSSLAPSSSCLFLSTGSSNSKRTPLTDDATKLVVRDGLLVSERSKKKKRPSKRSFSRAHKGTRASTSRPNRVPVLIPGGAAEPSTAKDLSSLSRSSPYYHGRSDRFGGGGNLTQILTTVNFSALLNPKDYIKKSATPGGIVTISGADAARRLLRGKQELIDVMHRELLEKPRSKRNPPKPYALTGHGVPQQLLQNHINLADALLTHHNSAAECSFTNFHGDLSFHWMRIRSRKGENRACQWPPKDPAVGEQDWEAQMELYMTVMNRLASNLGTALRRDEPLVTITSNNDEDDDFVMDTTTWSTMTPRYWSVELLRGMAYPPHLLPKHEQLLPIVEWTPRRGISAPGHVCIRLQGLPEKQTIGKLRRRKKRIPVTLVFDACFRSNVPQR